MIGLKREHNLAIRVLALVGLLVIAPIGWKGRLMLGGMGAVALAVWYRNHL